MVIASGDTMDAKGKEKGILKLEPRQKVVVDARSELTPQGSWDRPPSSPQPSVDRLSVTWADPGSMTSSVNLFHLPSETPVSNEVKFSPSAGDGSEDEDYSASLSAVLRQRRASVRRSRKGRTRRPSSPFMADDTRSRRRSSVFTTSSGDTAISMDEGQPVVSQEQIFENIHLHKEVLGSVKQQPLGMRRKLKIVHQAKGYIKRHQGQLQERLAQSKNTRDIYARFNILMNTKWQQMKREAANTSNLLIPWELRIKEIESHFGSVVASYFTFLRWLFWVNLVIAFILLVFVIVPEYLTANPSQDGERKIIMEEERRNASNLLTLWEFEGILKFSPIFYGYYSNLERAQYRMPLAYFLTGLVVYIYSFVAILRKMAENSRMSKLSEKEDECIFSWKLFTGWDFMIGNAETAHNRIASVILGFKEALLEEAEKKKDLRNWRIISLRTFVNICVVILLGVSAYAVVTVVSRSDDNNKVRNWWRENETTVVVTVISITFPIFFEMLGFLEHYHPRKQLRLQLARIMLLNLLNLYSLIFALFSKIEGMSKDLDALKPTLSMNATMISENTLNISESLATNLPMSCIEVAVSCSPCNVPLAIPVSVQYNKLEKKSIIGKSSTKIITTMQPTTLLPSTKSRIMEPTLELPEQMLEVKKSETVLPQNLIDNVRYRENHFTSKTTKIEDRISTEKEIDEEIFITTESNKQDMTTTKNDITTKSNDEDRTTMENYITSENNYKDRTTTEDITLQVQNELKRLREMIMIPNSTAIDDTSSEINDDDYNFDDLFSSENSSFSDTETTLDNFVDDKTDSTDVFTKESSTVTFDDATSSSLVYDTNSTETENSLEDTISTQLYESDATSDSTETTASYNTESSSDNTFSDIPPTIFTINTDVSYTNGYIKPEPITEKEKESYDTTTDFEVTISTLQYTDETSSDLPTTMSTLNTYTMCPNISFNCSVTCGGINITQVFFMSNCTIVEKKCYTTQCTATKVLRNITAIDLVYEDSNKRKMYNLTKDTKKKLLKLCWETMFGQELVKLTMMDLVFVLLGTLFMDFFRALFVRHMNRCWCWDLEKRFPEYGDFKIAENILHLINNQGMVWMGMFFSPGLVVLNVSKLMIMMYLRSWAVMTCNVPHEVVFRVSKSNNFYLALLLTMLFLCVLPVGYTIVWVKPSWHCGPFSEYDKIYYILTSNIHKILPTSLNFTLEYISSPAIVIPMLVLLILIIYYLTSLTNSLREANNDLKIQLRRERTEERRKMFQLADTRRRAGSSALDNTPFARWKKALPSLPLSKSIDSDDRKTITGDDNTEPLKAAKKRGGIFAKIVGMALDKKTDVEAVPEIDHNNPASFDNLDDLTDTEFHETLPKEVLKIKDIVIVKHSDHKRKNNKELEDSKSKESHNLKVKLEKLDDRTEKKAVIEKQEQESVKEKPFPVTCEVETDGAKKINKKLPSQSSSQSKQSDSIGSVIPVITISTTESDDEMLQHKKGKEEYKSIEGKVNSRNTKNSSEVKSLQRQSSVDSTNEQNGSSKNKSDNGHKYQNSL